MRFGTLMTTEPHAVVRDRILSNILSPRLVLYSIHLYFGMWAIAACGEATERRAAAVRSNRPARRVPRTVGLSRLAPWLGWVRMEKTGETKSGAVKRLED